MAERPFRHLTSHTDREVLVLTITSTELRGDRLTDHLLEELRRALADVPGAPRVVLDFQRVTFLTSLGIAALLCFRRWVRERGGQLLLCGLSATIADVLFAAKLASTSSSARIPFAITLDVPTAVAHLAQAPVEG
jgi:anti-anti-sigma factor